jgi:hypothetical protein
LQLALTTQALNLSSILLNGCGVKAMTSMTSAHTAQRVVTIHQFVQLSDELYEMARPTLELCSVEVDKVSN